MRNSLRLPVIKWTLVGPINIGRAPKIEYAGGANWKGRVAQHSTRSGDVTPPFTVFLKWLDVNIVRARRAFRTFNASPVGSPPGGAKVHPKTNNVHNGVNHYVYSPSITTMLGGVWFCDFRRFLLKHELGEEWFREPIGWVQKEYIKKKN